MEWKRTFEWGQGVYIEAEPTRVNGCNFVMRYHSGMGNSDTWHVLEIDDDTLVVVSWDTRYPYLGWEVFDRNHVSSICEGVFQESQFDELFQKTQFDDLNNEEVAEHVFRTYIQHVICG